MSPMIDWLKTPEGTTKGFKSLFITLNYLYINKINPRRARTEKLLTIQKKGLRSVIPGYVRYFYKNGVMPTGTKSFFKKYNILTVQSVIAKNTLLYMIKI